MAQLYQEKQAILRPSTEAYRLGCIITMSMDEELVSTVIANQIALDLTKCGAHVKGIHGCAADFNKSKVMHRIVALSIS